MTDQTAPTTDESTEGTEKMPTNEPFLSVFDVPVKTTRTARPGEALEFDPSQLYDSFAQQADEERAAYEQNEAEIAELLVRRAKLLEQQATLLDELAELNTTLDQARGLPQLIETMLSEQTALAPQFQELRHTGESLENERDTLAARITELEQFAKKIERERAETITRFGGGEKGEQRFVELEEKTRQSIELNRQELADTEERYESWRLAVTEAAGPLVGRLNRPLEHPTLMSQTLAELEAAFQRYIETQQTLNNKTSIIVEKHKTFQQAIDEILADERIPTRIAELEAAIEREREQFMHTVSELVLDQNTSGPVVALVRELANTFFVTESQTLAQTESLLDRAEQATALGKSLRATFTKIVEQTNVDLKQLFEHLKHQREKDTNNQLPNASRGYNDILFFASVLGTTGTSGKVFEPFAIEARALKESSVDTYVRRRATVFLPVFSVVQAALDLADTQN